jgi:hypothetical protein
MIAGFEAAVLHALRSLAIAEALALSVAQAPAAWGKALTMRLGARGLRKSLCADQHQCNGKKS